MISLLSIASSTLKKYIHEAAGEGDAAGEGGRYFQSFEDFGCFQHEDMPNV
jgi:hypothetical protein